MRVVDASIAIAAFAPWHDHHEAADAAVRPATGIVAHAALEAYSVLTRLPGPFLAEGAVVVAFLRQRFGARHLALAEADQASVAERLEELGITGGAVYDGLIALTASARNASLLTLDRRALPTYRACGARVDLLL